LLKFFHEHGLAAALPEGQYGGLGPDVTRTETGDRVIKLYESRAMKEKVIEWLTRLGLSDLPANPFTPSRTAFIVRAVVPTPGFDQIRDRLCKSFPSPADRTDAGSSGR
jgi:hypothetical protein